MKMEINVKFVLNDNNMIINDMRILQERNFIIVVESFKVIVPKYQSNIESN